MISLDKLTNIYNNWGDTNNLQPLASADEVMRRDDLTDAQISWLFRFINAWEETQKREYILDKIKQLKN
jgi:hypothetical protein